MQGGIALQRLVFSYAHFCFSFLVLSSTVELNYKGFKTNLFANCRSQHF